MQKLEKAIPFVIAGVMLIIALGMYRDALAGETASKAHYVQTVCDAARAENSGESEEACGVAQDSANAEYLCSSYASNARCWVEVK